MYEPTENHTTVRALWIAPRFRDYEQAATTLAREGVEVEHLSSVQSAFDVIEDVDLVAPHCVFVDPALPGVRTLLLAMRAQPNLSHIPVVYISDRISSAVLDSAHALGADDVMWTADESWLRMLCARLSAYRPELRPPTVAGQVFIMHPRDEPRRMLARVLRNAGFDVVFGLQQLDLVRSIERGLQPRLVIASRSAMTDGMHDVRALRTQLHQPELPWILLNEKQDRPFSLGARGAENVATLAEGGPADNVLFLMNELLAGADKSGRRSRRYLLNGLCSFRGQNESSYHFATLYSLSRHGMFVRTLVPLERDEPVCLELQPPGQPRVHLRGRVAWSRQINQPNVAPPGFGVQLLPEHCPPIDLQTYERGYEVLARDVDSRPETSLSIAPSETSELYAS